MRMVLIAGCLLLAGALVPAAWADQGVAQGVYQYVVEQSTAPFDQIPDRIAGSLEGRGFQVLARIEAGAPEGCKRRALVLTALDPEYARALARANRLTGPFAAVDRIAVFEDERGVHVAIVNPGSINRTILMDDPAQARMTEEHGRALREAVGAAVPGTASERQYGQMREKGHIGRTMGVVAGGSFDGKVKDVAELPGADLEEVVRKLRAAMAEGDGKWGMRLAYVAEIDPQTRVMGTSGRAMEAKSFDIVKAGSDESRSEFDCPGMAYAGAYPIEVVVLREGDVVKVRLVNVMYRMKMYFEDAGKVAFMKNMSMPGSIQDEVEGQIRAGLGLPDPGERKGNLFGDDDDGF